RAESNRVRNSSCKSCALALQGRTGIGNRPFDSWGITRIGEKVLREFLSRRRPCAIATALPFPRPRLVSWTLTRTYRIALLACDNFHSQNEGGASGRVLRLRCYAPLRLSDRVGEHLLTFKEIPE